jgi:CIC family chloride channel protein
MKTFLHSRPGFFLLALITGLLVGASTVVLIEVISLLQDIVFNRYGSDKIFWLIDKSDWSILLAPVFGGILVGIILRNIPEQRYHGIADVMEASAMRAGRMDVRSGGIAALATWVSLGSGAPLGREGPAVHIGASLTAWIAENLGLERAQSIALLGCAAAAAVTASFNTPIAGVLFALEVIVGYYSLRVFTPVVVAAMGAVMIRRSVYGNGPEFTLPDYAINSFWELLAFAALGLVAAFVVQSFIYLVMVSQDTWKKTPVPQWMRPAFAGLIIGCMALYYPLILGVGYEGTSLALSEQLSIGLMFALLLTKLIGGAVALGSGFAGGVFSPSLFMGAMLGGVFWFAVETVVPLQASSQGVYSVVGMAAVASAMLGAPISTLLIVFELTINYDLVIAVMLASAMASTCMQVMPYGSFFRWQLQRRGINLHIGRDQSLLRTRNIDEFISDKFIVASSADSLSELQHAMGAAGQHYAIVNDENGVFCGGVSAADIVNGRASIGQTALCEQVLSSTADVLPVSTSLLAAQQKFNDLNNRHCLPVTRTGEGGLEVVGVVYRDDVLFALYDLMREARSEEYGANK